MIKYLIAALLAFCVYVACGALAPMTGHAALIVTLFGSFGVFTYKGLLALTTLGLVVRNG